MVDRSVPFYKEIQQMIGELVQDFAVPATAVYDLGCATQAIRYWPCNRSFLLPFILSASIIRRTCWKNAG